MHYTRRKVLGAVGISAVLPLAGCIGSDEDDDESSSGTQNGESSGANQNNGDGSGTGSGSGTQNTVTRQSQREELVNRKVSVSEDDYRGWTFSLNSDATLEYNWTVRQGPEIEIFVMEKSEYSHLRSGERFHAEDSSGIGGSGSVDLSSDKEWAFVIDNSEAGYVSPPTNFDDDVAMVEVESYLVG